MFDTLKLVFRTFHWRNTAQRRATSSRRVLLKLEVLEDRFLLTGPVPNVVTTDMWQPVDAGNLASDPKNWSAGQVPNGLPAVFDGSKAANNQPIVWNQNISPSSISLQNGYQQQMELNSGVVVSISQNIAEDAKSSLNLDFQDTSCTFAVFGGTSTLTNFDFEGLKGLFEIAQNAWVNIGGNYNEQSWATIAVLSGGTLEVHPGTKSVLLDPFSVNGADIYISSGGSLYLDGGGLGPAPLILTPQGSGSIINNDGGRVDFDGVPGVTNQLAIPFLNDGQFNVRGFGSAKQAGGTLELQNTDPQTANSDLDMIGGELNLLGRATLVLDHSYTQSAGTLQTYDSLAEMLQIGPWGNPGSATISGGYIAAEADSGYNQLFIICSTLSFAGEYDPRINGAVSGSGDLLSVSGQMQFQPGSVISLTVDNGLGNGQWTIVKATQGFKGLNNYTTKPAGTLFWPSKDNDSLYYKN